VEDVISVQSPHLALVDPGSALTTHGCLRAGVQEGPTEGVKDRARIQLAEVARQQSRLWSVIFVSEPKGGM
jgi:hypothetical protein